MSYLVLLICIAMAFFLGALVLFGVAVERLWHNDDKDTLFDDSNVHNPVRVLTNTILHPKDLNRQFLLSDELIQKLEDMGYEMKSVYHYIQLDELTEVVKSREQIG